MILNEDCVFGKDLGFEVFFLFYVSFEVWIDLWNNGLLNFDECLECILYMVIFNLLIVCMFILVLVLMIFYVVMLSNGFVKGKIKI